MSQLQGEGYSVRTPSNCTTHCIRLINVNFEFYARSSSGHRLITNLGPFAAESTEMTTLVVVVVLSRSGCGFPG